MPSTQPTSIVEYFADLTDPRRREGTYPLMNFVVIGVCAVICGADDFVAMAEFGRTKKKFLEQVLDLSAGIPSHDRFDAIFASIKSAEFETCLLNWVTAVHEVTAGQVVAIDGKTLRRSYDKANSKSAIHMVSTWATAHPQLAAVKKTASSYGEQGGPLSTIHVVALLGVMVVVFGYGMYEPAAYSAVRQFTSPKTAAMGYAMLYALMNLGAWLPTFFSPVRQAIGISGVYWILTGFTVAAPLCTVILLSRRTVRDAIEKASRERRLAEGTSQRADGSADQDTVSSGSENANSGQSAGFVGWLKRHPMADLRFTFFIFALLPVQTLFAHNWLTLPMYVQRAYRESWPWISANFEPAVSFNPLLIFILVPIVAALTSKVTVYNLMIAGTFIMAAPTFLLALGPTVPTLIGYLVIMTVGEAIWQPRFLQFAAEIAPPGRTGAYIGVARLPWFLTKMIVPLYSGFFLDRFCPQKGAVHSETMWLIYGFIAMSSTVLLVAAKPWAAKGLKTGTIDSP